MGGWSEVIKKVKKCEIKEFCATFSILVPFGGDCKETVWFIWGVEVDNILSRWSFVMVCLTK